MSGTHKTGIHPGIPFDAYAGWDLVNQSLLGNLINRSPAYARWDRMHPEPSTPAQLLGQAVHHAVLQPDDFLLTFTAAPNVDRRTKAGKEDYAAFMEESKGKTAVSADDWDRCLAMRDAVHRHPLAKALLALCEHREVCLVWEEPAYGVSCKARLDALGGTVIGDLKTSRDAHPNRFERAALQYGLHRQGAFYRRGAKALGLKPSHFGVIAVENTPPHEVAVYSLDDYALRAGEAEIIDGLKRYARCLESGEWPGYPTDNALSLTLPDWYLRKVFPDEF